MTIGILGVTESQAKVFLSIAGILDVLAAILIYIPKTTKIALSYVLIWGLLTAFARVVFGFNSNFILDSIHDSLYGTIYRLPHGLIAGIILMMILKTSSNKVEIESNTISNSITNPNNLNPKTI
jgi:ABC-type dipeptide/oligopeptide/nickel transport system permease component